MPSAMVLLTSQFASLTLSSSSTLSRISAIACSSAMQGSAFKNTSAPLAGQLTGNNLQCGTDHCSNVRHAFYLSDQQRQRDDAHVRAARCIFRDVRASTSYSTGSPTGRRSSSTTTPIPVTSAATRATVVSHIPHHPRPRALADRHDSQHLATRLGVNVPEIARSGTGIFHHPACVDPSHKGGSRRTRS